MKKLTRHRMKCSDCGDTIESTHGRDFVTCSCWYKTRCCNADLTDAMDTGTEAECSKCGSMDFMLRGLGLDGGTSCPRMLGNFSSAIDLREYEETE